jgi:LPXTG-motif cell wall-anchored protein
MKKWQMMVFMVCLTLMVLVIPFGANADEWNRKTKVSFDQPVEIPGVGAQILPAGTYIFKLLDSLSDRNIVQIFNEKQDHVFATILAIPNYRLQATDKTVMTFRERAVGSPEAIRAWFYPGKHWGQEFVYPKKRAIELAKITNEPVLAMPAELDVNIVAPVLTADEQPVVALKTASIIAVKPTGEEVAVAEVVEPPPATEIVEPTPVKSTEVVTPVPAKSLPKTASALPMIALIGILSLGAGITLFGMKKRSA